MGPADLNQILEIFPPITDKRFYNKGPEDAAVFHINSETSLVQTVDFITPVLNDPYSFGAVTAANALSDIYAMGANPVFALNIVSFPVKSLPINILQEVLKGGASIAAEAGMSIVGGHSIEDNTPKYGMVVTGTCSPDHLVYKKGALPGDKLFLTKPLGSGILTTAIDRELVGREIEDKVFALMVRLNRDASEAMKQVGVNACTDISGFGLLGHLHEMLNTSGVAARLYNNSIPVMEEVYDLAHSGVVPAGSHNNFRYIQNKVQWDEGVNAQNRIILCDAQTSGGLLISVSPERADELHDALVKQGCLATACIGEVMEGVKGSIQVIPKC